MYFVSSEKSSGSYWLSHNALPFRFHLSDRECKRDSRYDFEITQYYQAFFMKGKQNISSLHKIICSLVTSYKLISYLKEKIKFNQLSTPESSRKDLDIFLWERILLFSIRPGCWVVPSRICFFEIQFLAKHFDFL